MWLIDHTRAFRWDEGLMKPDQLTAVRTGRPHADARSDGRIDRKRHGRREDETGSDRTARAARPHRETLRRQDREVRRSGRNLHARVIRGLHG